MTALPIDPHQVELAARVVEMTGPNPEPPAVVRAAFEAGIEAERARAAAETTEEWGFRVEGTNRWPTPRGSARHAHDTVREGAEDGIAFEAVRRLVGPWEVQS